MNFDESLINQQNIKLCKEQLVAWSNNLAQSQLGDDDQAFLDSIDEIFLKYQLMKPRQKIDYSNVIPFKKRNS